MNYKLIEAPSSNRKIHELYNMMASGDLILQPSFQRKLVWNNKHKENFIDTILNGFPFPEVYFADGEMDLKKKKAPILVVDGQQRLSTIYQYITGDEALECKRIPRYEELSEEDQKCFLSHPVVVRDLKSISDEEIKEVFKRINSVSYALNAVEIENALYEGEFISVAKDISNAGLIEKLNFIDDSGFARMKDLEFILLIMATAEIGTYFANNKEIEPLIKQYDNEYPNSDKMKNAVTNVMEYILSLELSPDSIWLSKSGMFTLISELIFRCLKFRKELPNKEMLNAELIKLNDAIKDNDRKDSYSEFYYYMYQATGSKKGRVSRGKVLRSVMENI